jgi:hypothetical protein
MGEQLRLLHYGKNKEDKTIIGNQNSQNTKTNVSVNTELNIATFCSHLNNLYGYLSGVVGINLRGKGLKNFQTATPCSEVTGTSKFGN